MMNDDQNNQNDRYGQGRNYGNDPIEGLYAYRPQREAYRSRRISIRTILLAVIIVMGVVVWYAYPRGADRFEDIELPLVRADNQPYKILPANRGGMDIPHQDSTIYDAMEGGEEPVVETLLPEPERPMDRNDINVIGARPDNSLVQAPDMNLDVKLTDTPVTPTVNNNDNQARLIRVPQGTPTGDTVNVFNDEDVLLYTAPEPEPAPEPEEVVQAPVVVPQEKPAAIERAQEPVFERPIETTAVLTPTTPSAPVVTGGVTHYVQLGAFRSEEAAQSEYEWRKSKYSGIITGYPVRYQFADLGAKGIYYRLQVGPMSEVEAQSVCNRILAITSGGCIVTK